MSKAVIDSGEDENYACDAAHPEFDMCQFVERLSQHFPTEGDYEGKYDDGNSGSGAVDERKDDLR